MRKKWEKRQTLAKTDSWKEIANISANSSWIVARQTKQLKIITKKRTKKLSQKYEYWEREYKRNCKCRRVKNNVACMWERDEE